MNQILAVGGEPALLDAVGRRLEGRNCALDTFADAEAAIAHFESDGADLALACLPLAVGGGGDLIRGLHEIDRRLSVVVVGTDAQIRSSADAFALDAFEHVENGERDMNDLLAAIGGALGSRRGDAQLRYMRQREASGSSWTSVVGTSQAMQEVISVLRRVGERTTRGAAPTILLRGETGTGKGLIAKCIHYSGPRRNRAFVEINCAAIPGTLLESELFGYERGAFTDARSARAGLFETAHQGTLFLDEISSLSIDLQAKLLTAIEEKRIRRLGGRTPIQVDAQIVTASHTDLGKRVANGEFRADLYHRLNVISVTIPPLRKREEDRVLLAQSFIESMCREYGMAPRPLSDAAKRYIVEYPWPGNVRELKNQIERLLLLGTDGPIEPEAFNRTSTAPPPPSSRGGGFSMSLPDEGIGLEEVERELIRQALSRCEGNVSQAARFLRITRQTLMYRMKKHGLNAT